MHSACTENQAELLAAGTPASLLPAIAAAGASLAATLSDQRFVKEARPTSTASCTAGLNNCYVIMMHIIGAGRRVYRSDAAKKAQYTYRRSRNDGDDGLIS